jgi:archaellum component FlaC
MSEYPKSNEQRSEQTIQPEQNQESKFLEQPQLPYELLTYNGADEYPKGWTPADVVACLEIVSPEQHQAFCKTIAERTGAEEYDVEQELREYQKKVFSSLGEFIKTEEFDLESYYNLNKGINKARVMQGIRLKELATDADVLTSAIHEINGLQEELKQLDNKVKELESAKNPSKALHNPQKPSIFSQLKSAFGSSEDSPMAVYQKHLQEDEATKKEIQQINERLPQIKAEIEDIKKRQMEVASKLGLATKRYEDLRKLFTVKAEAVFEEKRPLLEKRIQEQKQKYEQVFGYWYNAAFLDQTPSDDPFHYVGFVDKDGKLPADYEEPQATEYQADIAKRIEFIVKDMQNPLGWARRNVFADMDERTVQRVIKTWTK